MLQLVIAALLVLSTPALPVQQLANTGLVSPVYGGTGAPAMPCGNTGTYNQTVGVYIQTDAIPGRALWYAQQNADSSCAWVQRPSPGATGIYINQLNLTGATSQTICPADTTCAAGFYHIDFYVNVTQTATLGSITALNLTYTDDLGPTTVNLASVASAQCPSLSLLATSRCSVGVNIYHAPSTAVTVATTLSAITGSPKYNFRAIALQNQ